MENGMEPVKRSVTSSGVASVVGTLESPSGGGPQNQKTGENTSSSAPTDRAAQENETEPAVERSETTTLGPSLVMGTLESATFGDPQNQEMRETTSSSSFLTSLESPSLSTQQHASNNISNLCNVTTSEASFVVGTPVSVIDGARNRQMRENTSSSTPTTLDSPALPYEQHPSISAVGNNVSSSGASLSVGVIGGISQNHGTSEKASSFSPATLEAPSPTLQPAVGSVSSNKQQPNTPSSPRKRKACQPTTVAVESPAVTLYDHKKSTRCTIHRPTLQQLQDHVFTDYVRNYVLPAASVRYKCLVDDESPFQHLTHPMKLREGIAKIVLPAGFETRPLVQDRTGRGADWQSGTTLGGWEISSPIQQNLRGIAGVYEYTFTDQSPIKLTAFREKADEYRVQQVGCALDDKEEYFCMDDETGTKQLTQERLEALERIFWKRLGPTMPPPWYGADQPGSLFAKDDHASGWSLAQMDSCLHVLRDIPGVTSSYIYAGMWASVFCAHTEDMNLLSINYLHAGQPKVWYAVAEPDAARFLTLAQFQFALQAAKCTEFLRHKRYLLSPAVLKKSGIRYQTAVQYPGEAIITFPASYHFGFNLGFNVAEATNFGVPEWFPFGRRAKICMCRPHSVHIDMDRLASLLERYEHDQKSLRRGSRLTWKEWGRKREQIKRQEEDKKVNAAKAAAANVTQLPGIAGHQPDNKSKKAKLSEQQRKNEFWVEVMKPIGVKALEKKKKSKRQKAVKEEIWHLAKPIGHKGLRIDAKVLFMAPVKTMSVVVQGQGDHTNEPEDGDRSDKGEEETEEQCFAGQVVEKEDDHVRIHIDGLPKSQDLWMASSSSKLFLDGGRWNDEDEVQGIPALHYWQEMDSKQRCPF